MYVSIDGKPQVRSVQMSGNSLLTGCYDGVVRDWDLFTGKIKVLILHHEVNRSKVEICKLSFTKE